MKVVWEHGKVRFRCETEEDYDPQKTIQRMIEAGERELARIKAEESLSATDVAPEEQSSTAQLNQ